MQSLANGDHNIHYTLVINQDAKLYQQQQTFLIWHSLASFPVKHLLQRMTYLFTAMERKHCKTFLFWEDKRAQGAKQQSGETMSMNPNLSLPCLAFGILSKAFIQLFIHSFNHSLRMQREHHSSCKEKLNNTKEFCQHKILYLIISLDFEISYITYSLNWISII